MPSIVGFSLLCLCITLVACDKKDGGKPNHDVNAMFVEGDVFQTSCYQDDADQYLISTLVMGQQQIQFNDSYFYDQNCTRLHSADRLVFSYNVVGPSSYITDGQNVEISKPLRLDVIFFDQEAVDELNAWKVCGGGWIVGSMRDIRNCEDVQALSEQQSYQIIGDEIKIGNSDGPVDENGFPIELLPTPYKTKP